MFSLKHKIALVTGGASGIGAGIAGAFIAAGATVWIADRDESAGAAMATKLGARFIPLNVASETVCAEAAEKVGAISILANVAGIGHVGSLLGTTASDLDRLHAVSRGNALAYVSTIGDPGLVEFTGHGVLERDGLPTCPVEPHTGQGEIRDPS